MEEVLMEAICMIDGFLPIKEYNYILDDERHYLSWVQSRKLCCKFSKASSE